MARSSVLGSAVRIQPGPGDRESARELSEAVAGATELTLRLPDGGEFQLPAALVEILRASARKLSEGNTVTILASEVLLTPAEAGELLGFSRPYVARLLDQGQIPSEFLPNSRHRVIRLEDLLDFQTRRDRRRAGRERILDATQSEDLP